METAASTTDAPAISPPVISRRRFFTKLLAAAAVPAVAGYYAHKVEPFWPRFPEIPVRIKGLPKSFENFRIAQITDMHVGHANPDFLKSALSHVVTLKPDLVVFTGDLIHHNSDWIDYVAQLVKMFPMPTFASYGNHDYGVFRGEDEPYQPNLADDLEAALHQVGCTVLRNESRAIKNADGRLWLAGLDDLWYGDFQPKLAFKNIPSNEPVIALSHNPDTAEMLDPLHPDLILAGHTHGGQIRLPIYGPLRLNVAQTQYDWGLFRLPNSQLYVSSGIGYILQARFNCRPEVPVFRLVNA